MGINIPKIPKLSSLFELRHEPIPLLSELVPRAQSHPLELLP